MNKKHTSKSPRILQVRKGGAYDCVYVNGKKIRLGRTGTPETEANFRKVQVQVLTDPTYLSPKPQQVTVDCLGFAYLEYAEKHDPGHFSSIKTAVGILVKHFAGQPVDILDTRHFLFLQDMFVERGVSAFLSAVAHREPDIQFRLTIPPAQHFLQHSPQSTPV